MRNGTSSHWFYLPKEQDWAVINGHEPMTAEDNRLADFIKYRTTGNDQVHFVGMRDGEVIIPDAQVLTDHQGLADGEVQVFSMNDLKDSQSLEKSSTNE
jgi:hypothetical protein